MVTKNKSVCCERNCVHTQTFLIGLFSSIVYCLITINSFLEYSDPSNLKCTTSGVGFVFGLIGFMASAMLVYGNRKEDYHFYGPFIGFTMLLIIFSMILIIFTSYSFISSFFLNRYVPLKVAIKDRNKGNALIVLFYLFIFMVSLITTSLAIYLWHIVRRSHQYLKEYRSSYVFQV